MVDLVCVPPHTAHLVWPLVSHFIRDAMALSESGTFADVEQDVLQADALLWLPYSGTAIAGAVVTQVDADKICTIVAAGGSDAKHCVQLITKIEDYARTKGCTAVRIHGRTGWARLLPGYRTTRITLERRL